MIPRAIGIPTEDDWDFLASLEPDPYRPSCRRRNGDHWEAVQAGDQTWRMHDPNPGRDAGIGLWLQEEQERSRLEQVQRLQEEQLRSEANAELTAARAEAQVMALRAELEEKDRLLESLGRS